MHQVCGPTGVALRPDRGGQEGKLRICMTTAQAQPIARASERGAATRSALLAAAREVFTTEGYAQAAVTDIVNRAGASVGSLYHHFSGKADLYLSLYEELNQAQAERTRRAGRRARDAGITDPKQLFLVGAREDLNVCVEQPELFRLFVGGDGPPGFDLVRRQRPPARGAPGSSGIHVGGPRPPPAPV